MDDLTTSRNSPYLTEKEKIVVLLFYTPGKKKFIIPGLGETTIYWCEIKSTFEIYFEREPPFFISYFKISIFDSENILTGFYESRNTELRGTEDGVALPIAFVNLFGLASACKIVMTYYPILME